MADDANSTTTPDLIPQERVNAIVAEEKRKLAEKFAGFDDLKAKAARLDEIEAASKSELQKAQDIIANLARENDKFKAEKQVSTWAAEIVKGSEVPPSVLRGSTREELESHFKDIKDIIALVGAAKPKRSPVPPGTPSGDKAGSRAVAALRELRGA